MSDNILLVCVGLPAILKMQANKWKEVIDRIRGIKYPLVYIC